MHVGPQDCGPTEAVGAPGLSRHLDAAKTDGILGNDFLGAPADKRNEVGNQTEGRVAKEARRLSRGEWARWWRCAGWSAAWSGGEVARIRAQE